MLSGVVSVLGIGFKGDLGVTQHAVTSVSFWKGDIQRQDLPLDIKTYDFDAQVIFTVYCFLTCIELLPFVYVFTTCIITSPVDGVSETADI